MQLRVCEARGIEKPHSEYPRAKTYKDGIKPQCWLCFKEREKLYRAHYCKEKRKAVRRRFNYGLEPEDFDRMFAAQDGKCGICKSSMERPHVDHDHETGRIRGLLCKLCNAGLGQFKDNPTRLRLAADYLERG